MGNISKFAVRTLTAAVVLAAGVAAQQAGGQRLRVSSELQQAKIVSTAMPVYPVLAKRGRIEGTVKLQAVIDKDGKVDKVETLSGHPILEQAAVEAVRKWRYRPTVLNGENVEVVTTIDVVFKLS
jgi:protein TonB